MIFILEDNEDRVRQFLAAAALVAPEMGVRVWRDARQMLADLVDGLENAAAISLDHDLEREANQSRDPGSGYDVATVLAELIPCCPVIVHTSNGERGNWMVAALSRAGWKHARVYPNGDDRIAKDWAPVLRRYLSAQCTRA